MAVKALRLILSPVVDWPATRAWYHDVLGLEETGGWDGGAGNRGSFLRVGPGEIELLEMPISAFTLLPETDGQPTFRLALPVDDLNGEWHRLQGHSVRILQPPTVRPWGSRDFIIADPNGLPILLFQHDTEV
jgi:catechol 2,3-dioxygenase-like lactoylglutathione lyase family enzyme